MICSFRPHTVYPLRPSRTFTPSPGNRLGSTASTEIRDSSTCPSVPPSVCTYIRQPLPGFSRSTQEGRRSGANLTPPRHHRPTRRQPKGRALLDKSSETNTHTTHQCRRPAFNKRPSRLGLQPILSPLIRSPGSPTTNPLSGRVPRPALKTRSHPGPSRRRMHRDAFVNFRRRSRHRGALTHRVLSILKRRLVLYARRVRTAVLRISLLKGQGKRVTGVFQTYSSTSSQAYIHTARSCMPLRTG
jgi:hypothetical protein